jgi:hypothetical protein
MHHILSVLGGKWHFFELLSSDGESLSLNHISDPLFMQGLSFVNISSLKQARHQVSVISCGSSLVLLAGFTTTSTTKINLLLWDMQYSILLAEDQVSGSAAATLDADMRLSISLIDSDASSSPLSQVILAVTQAPAIGKAKSNKTLAKEGVQGSPQPGTSASIVVVPISLPKSTIANAMGRAKDGEKWAKMTAPPLIDPARTRDGTIYGTVSSVTPAQEGLVSYIRSVAAHRRGSDCDVKFFQWVKDVEESDPTLVGQGPVSRISDHTFCLKPDGMFYRQKRLF